uniref:Cytochrome c6 n=1 Tax=Balbiania investiens TaxID=111861 RepID=A0A4D6BKL8_9FLOR|nr:cytochrome c553 [Balbiania investiens]QBX88546.1 cytochrome c553 [Balbiania investiens]
MNYSLDFIIIILLIIGKILMSKLFSFLAILVSVPIVNTHNIAFAADIIAGEQIFSANCAACHSGGNNAIMPEKTLKKDILAANGMNSVDAITNQVTNGKNAMPAFGGRLAEEDIENVANYVLSQSEQGW